MTLAIFDLDHTLLSGDSDYLFGEFLVAKNRVDKQDFQHHNEIFYQQYVDQTLDIHQYVEFCTTPLRDLEQTQLDTLHEEFFQAHVAPLMRQDGVDAINEHKAKGHVVLILTATNDYISTPIAQRFNVDDILATDLQRKDGKISGKILGTPCFREGKVSRIAQWLEQNPGHSLDDSYFYSDSFNDLPLLQAVKYPVVVTPDERLAAHAQANNWPIVNFG